MTSSDLKNQQETRLHFWNIRVRSAKDIHKATKIPMRTIYNNLKKLTKKITPTVAVVHQSEYTL